MKYPAKKLVLGGLSMVGLCAALVPTALGYYTRNPQTYLPALSNANATESAQLVYQYLASRRALPINGSEPKSVVGQHIGGINEIRYGGTNDQYGVTYRYFDMNESVYVIDGKHLGFVGTRYDALDKELNEEILDLNTCLDLNTELIAMWKQHQPLIQVTAGPRNPWDQSLGRDPVPAGSPTPGSMDIGFLHRDSTPTLQADIDAKARYWVEMDIIATALQQLEDAGVPVIFRPFAEFNQTNKYYWKGQTGTDFVALWNDVYDYYVNDCGLNNLIFCWEVWALNRNAASSDLAPFYPGDATVDLMAGAFYFEPTSSYLDGNGNFQFVANSYNESIYNFLTSQTRPFGAAQYGILNETGGSADNDFTLKFFAFAQDCSFTYYWYKKYDIAAQANATTFMSDGDVATAEDLPSLNQKTFISEAVNDGWTLESTETSSIGGSKNGVANPGLILGDSSTRQQYRSIVSFNTAGLPNILTSATLRLKRHSLSASGTSPFSWGGALVADIKGGSGFNGAVGLIKNDFEASPDASAVITSMSDAASDGTWSTGTMNSTGLNAVNETGTTQLRLRFTNGNNTGSVADYISWYSGESAAANQPQLVIQYKYQ